MGYSISVAGSDWKEFYVKDLTSGDILSDHLTWIKFSGMSWHGNGFYYKRYPRPDEHAELSAANDNAKVYYHQLGTSQEDDKLIYSIDEPGEYDAELIADMFGKKVSKKFILEIAE